MAILKLSTVYDSIENRREFEARVAATKGGMVYTMNKLYAENFVLFVSFTMKNLNLFNTLGIFDYSIQEVAGIQSQLKKLDEVKFKELCEEISTKYFSSRVPEEVVLRLKEFCPKVTDWSDEIEPSAKTYFRSIVLDDINRNANLGISDREVFSPNISQWTESVVSAHYLFDSENLIEKEFSNIENVETITDTIIEKCFEAISKLAEEYSEIPKLAKDDLFQPSCYKWHSFLVDFYVNYFELKSTELYKEWEETGKSIANELAEIDEELPSLEEPKSSRVVRVNFYNLTKDEVVEDATRYFNANLARKAYLSGGKQERPTYLTWAESVVVAWRSLKTHDKPNLYNIDDADKKFQTILRNGLLEDCKLGIMSAISHSDLIYDYNIDDKLPAAFNYWLKDLNLYFIKKFGIDEIQQV